MMDSDLTTHIAGRVMRWDADYSQRLHLIKKNGFPWTITAFLAHSGDSWFWAAGLGIIWLIARGRWHPLAAVLIISIVILAVLVLVIKFIVRRQRPPGEWGSIYRNTDPHSFPSGHAARAAMLVVLAWGLAPGWFAWLLTIWAPLVCLARVMTGLHYLSDVLAGILLGIIFAAIMLALHPWLTLAFPFLFDPHILSLLVS